MGAAGVVGEAEAAEEAAEVAAAREAAAAAEAAGGGEAAAVAAARPGEPVAGARLDWTRRSKTPGRDGRG